MNGKIKNNNRVKKVKKYIATTVVCLTALATLFSATGCSVNRERADVLSDNLVNTFNQEVVEYNPEYKMEDFKIIGTDVNKTAFEFDVNFNGIASFSDSTIGYTQLSYNVPSSYFSNIEKDSSSNDVYSVFDAIVKDLKPESISVSPVSDLIAINDAFVKNEPALFEGLNNNRALVFNLGVPEFDEETCTINFDMKTLVETKRGKVSPGFGIGIGFGGGVGMGVGIHTSSAEGTFVSTNNYKFTVDKDTFERMKADHSLVYDYCMDAINNKDATKLSAERKSITSVSYSNADLLHELNLKDVNNEFSK